MQDLLTIATDSQVMPEHRQVIGWIINIVMVANITFAVGIMLNQSIRETIRQIKIQQKRRLAIKTMKDRKTAKELRAIGKAATVQAKLICPPSNYPLCTIKEEPESQKLRPTPNVPTLTIQKQFSGDPFIRENNSGVEAVIRTNTQTIRQQRAAVIYKDHEPDCAGCRLKIKFDG